MRRLPHIFRKAVFPVLLFSLFACKSQKPLVTAESAPQETTTDNVVPLDIEQAGSSFESIAENLEKKNDLEADISRLGTILDAYEAFFDAAQKDCRAHIRFIRKRRYELSRIFYSLDKIRDNIKNNTKPGGGPINPERPWIHLLNETTRDLNALTCDKQ